MQDVVVYFFLQVYHRTIVLFVKSFINLSSEYRIYVSNKEYLFSEQHSKCTTFLMQYKSCLALFKKKISLEINKNNIDIV